MPIHAPHAHLYHSVKLEVAKAKLGHAGRKSPYAALNLVAYIDMMTMLVIFLLMSFSATGEILFVQKNIVLPDAQNWTRPRARAGHRRHQGRRHARRLAGRHRRRADEGLRHRRLQDHRAARQAGDRSRTTTSCFTRPRTSTAIAIIQSDKNVEFKMLRKGHVLGRRGRLPERQLRRSSQGQGRRSSASRRVVHGPRTFHPSELRLPPRLSRRGRLHQGVGRWFMWSYLFLGEVPSMQIRTS